MINGLVAAVVVVGVLAVGNLMLTFGLVHRLRLLYSRGSAPAMDPARPSEGLRVGEFSTGAIDGRTITDRDVAEGSVLVGFFADGCPNCARLVADLGIAQPHERMVAFVAGQRGDELTDRLTADLSGWCDAVAVVGVGDQVSQAFNLQAFPTLIRLVDGAVKKAGFTLEDMGLGARVRIMPAS